MVLCSVRAPSQECCRNNVECQRGGAGWVPAAEVYLGNWTEGQKKKKRSGKEPRCDDRSHAAAAVSVPDSVKCSFFSFGIL